MHGNGIPCLLCVGFLHGNEKQKVSAGNVHVEKQNQRLKVEKNKTKESKSLAERNVQKKKERKKRQKYCQAVLERTDTRDWVHTKEANKRSPLSPCNQ